MGMIIEIESKDNRYSFNHVELYKKGDLAGYIEGILTFNVGDREKDHEFLYRVDDKENGKDFTLVSIDYGYKIPYINDVWDNIEKTITEKINN